MKKRKRYLEDVDSKHLKHITKDEREKTPYQEIIRLHDLLIEAEVDFSIGRRLDGYYIFIPTNGSDVGVNISEFSGSNGYLNDLLDVWANGKYLEDVGVNLEFEPVGAMTAETAYNYIREFV